MLRKKFSNGNYNASSTPNFKYINNCIFRWYCKRSIIHSESWDTRIYLMLISKRF